MTMFLYNPHKKKITKYKEKKRRMVLNNQIFVKFYCLKESKSSHKFVKIHIKELRAMKRLYS